MWPRERVLPYSPIPDLSFLNEKPAGLRGRVRAQGAELVFADGTPARFWGANLQAYALFSTRPANIRAQAKRIAALGFNLIRIHHHDSHWVTPNVFGTNAPETTRLDPQSLDILDQWISALKDEGVYVWLDLHVGRRVTAADGIEDFDEITDAEGHADIHGYNYVSGSIRERMLEFQKAYMSHVNPFTGMAYRDDPAIIAVLISNENDLTHHFGNALLPDKNVPAHNALYMAVADAFAARHGLDREQIWRSWEFGAPKIFLNDMEQRFHAAMMEDLRQGGFEGLIATTNSWGNMSIAGLPSLSEGSLIDMHSYGGPGELDIDPLRQADMLSWVAAGQVADMPLSISEWNVSPFPAEDRFVSPLRVATSAAHQGWDAPMIYGYAQQPLNQALEPSNWDAASDPAMLAMLPAAALLYRRAHVQPARETYALRLTPAQLFAGISPENSVAIRTLYEQSRLVVELPQVPELGWLAPRRAAEGALVVTNPETAYLPHGAGFVESDTGEFRRDFARGLFTVDTARTQLAAGRLEGGEVQLSDIVVNMKAPMAAVAVQSLDGQPINGSEKILISIAGRLQPVEDGRSVYLREPLQGQLHIRAADGLRLRQLDGKTQPHDTENGVYMIDLSYLSGEQWLMLER
ncbi:hypothetical protein FGD77_01585 [Roseovarius sp. M141]|nr:hypothetical protein [Roseovarius sp. M141]